MTESDGWDGLVLMSDVIFGLVMTKPPPENTFYDSPSNKRTLNLTPRGMKSVNIMRTWPTLHYKIQFRFSHCFPYTMDGLCYPTWVDFFNYFNIYTRDVETMLSKRSLFKFAIFYNLAAILFQVLVDLTISDHLGTELWKNRKWFLTIGLILYLKPGLPAGNRWRKNSTDPPTSGRLHISYQPWPHKR